MAEKDLYKGLMYAISEGLERQKELPEDDFKGRYEKLHMLMLTLYAYIAGAMEQKKDPREGP